MSCTVNNLHRPLLRHIFTIAAIAGLAACGGGGSTTGPSVSNMAGVGAAYSKTFTVNIAGTSLNQGVTVTTEPGCGAMTLASGGTDTQQSFTCTLNAVGTVTSRVRNLDGVEIARVKVEVPLPQVTMTMTQVASGGTATGTIVVELDPVNAPITVNNFLAYVNGTAGFYKNTLFHRAEAGVVIQAGGFTSSLTPKTTGLLPPIVLESNNGLKNVRGTIGAARGSDPNSATSQFYFNLADNTGFDYVDANNPGYAVFGKIVSGQDIADKIGNVEVAEVVINGSNPPATLKNVPVNEVRITAISQTK